MASSSNPVLGIPTGSPLVMHPDGAETPAFVSGVGCECKVIPGQNSPWHPFPCPSSFPCPCHHACCSQLRASSASTYIFSSGSSISPWQDQGAIIITMQPNEHRHQASAEPAQLQSVSGVSAGQQIVPPDSPSRKELCDELSAISGLLIQKPSARKNRLLCPSTTWLPNAMHISLASRGVENCQQEQPLQLLVFQTLLLDAFVGC